MAATYNQRPSSRCTSSSHGWVRTTTWLVALYIFAICVNATVVCSDCRPIALQEAPAIGISLAPGYGAVSVRFVNGTTSDVVLVHGSEEYTHAMIRWQQLETMVTNTNYKSGQNDKTSAEVSSPNVVRSRVGTIRQALLRECRLSERSKDELNDNFEAVADMMAKLFQSTKESIALKHNRVFLAVPDFVTTTKPSLSRPTKPLLRQAQLETFGMHYQRQSQAALSHLYGLENCFGIPIDDNTEVPDTECEEYNGRWIQSVLFVAVDGVSLTLRSMLREDGMFYADISAAELLWKHDEVEDDTAFFAWVDRELRKFVETQDVIFDLLLLSGTKSTATEFQGIIQDIMKNNHNLRSEEYLWNEQDHAFAAARGAATSARVGMCNDFDACLPNSWCPISEHCSEWVWGREEAEGGKGEL